MNNLQKRQHFLQLELQLFKLRRPMAKNACILDNEVVYLAAHPWHQGVDVPQAAPAWSSDVRAATELMLEYDMSINFPVPNTLCMSRIVAEKEYSVCEMFPDEHEGSETYLLSKKTAFAHAALKLAIQLEQLALEVQQQAA